MVIWRYCGSIVLVDVPPTPDTGTHGASQFFHPPVFRGCIRRGTTSPVEQHHAREILIVDAALIFVTHASRLARDLPPPKIISEIAHRSARAGALDSGEP
jgi:hypothetical protein